MEYLSFDERIQRQYYYINKENKEISKTSFFYKYNNVIKKEVENLEMIEYSSNYLNILNHSYVKKENKFIFLIPSLNLKREDHIKYKDLNLKKLISIKELIPSDLKNIQNKYSHKEIIKLKEFNIKLDYNVFKHILKGKELFDFKYLKNFENVDYNTMKKYGKLNDVKLLKLLLKKGMEVPKELMNIDLFIKLDGKTLVNFFGNKSFNKEYLIKLLNESRVFKNENFIMFSFKHLNKEDLKLLTKKIKSHKLFNYKYNVLSEEELKEIMKNDKLSSNEMELITKNQNLTFDIIKENKNQRTRLSYKTWNTNKKYKTEFIKKNIDYIDINYIIAHQSLPSTLISWILKNKKNNELIVNSIIRYQKLDDKVLKNHINNENIYIHQDLSEDFLLFAVKDIDIIINILKHCKNITYKVLNKIKSFTNQLNNFEINEHLYKNEKYLNSLSKEDFNDFNDTILILSRNKKLSESKRRELLKFSIFHKILIEEGITLQKENDILGKDIKFIKYNAFYELDIKEELEIKKQNQEKELQELNNNIFI